MIKTKKATEKKQITNHKKQIISNDQKEKFKTNITY